MSAETVTITLTMDQVEAIRKHEQEAVIRMNKLAFVQEVFEGDVEMSLAACLGLAAILQEISIGQVYASNGQAPFDPVLQQLPR